MNSPTLLTLLSASVALSYDANTASPQEPSEYCELEQFRPGCPDGRVIVITEARYGLVSLGRCLQADFGYVGCFADVVEYVAGKCTGRRTCLQPVPDRYMKEAAARCRPEFSGFLYAAYKCIDAGDSRCASCRSEGAVQLNANTDGGGYIGSVVVDARQDSDGCGTARCPWIIQGQPGQVINLTLYEYSSQSDVVTSSSSSSSGSSSTSSLRHVARRPAAKSTSCGAGTRRYAVVKERSNPVDASICAEHHLRSDGHVTTSHVFTSVSYVIELRVVATRKSRDTTDDQSTAFLIHYQAVGCADMSPPANTVLRRIGDRSEVNCLLNELTSTVRCIDGQWQGEIEVCERPSFVPQSLGDSLADRIDVLYNVTYSYVASLHPGIVLTALVSVIVVTIVIVVTCCCVCCRRRQYKRRYNQSARQQTIQRTTMALPPGKSPAAAAAVTPKLLRGTADVYTEDVNNYTNAVVGASCAVHRPLPSLPRYRMDGSWAAKSVRSDASGSDASLHWGDTLDAPAAAASDAAAPAPTSCGGVSVDDLPPQGPRRTVRCRSVAAGAGAGNLDDDVDDEVGRTVPGYRTMPRPAGGSAQYGVLQIGDEVDQRRQMNDPPPQQQLRRQSQPVTTNNIMHVRQYANILDSRSVQV